MGAGRAGVKKRPLESTLRRNVIRLFRAKFGRNAVIPLIPDAANGLDEFPDLQVLIGNGITAFVELKRPGEVPRIGQRRTLDILRKMGYACFVVETMKQAQALIAPPPKEPECSPVPPNSPVS